MLRRNLRRLGPVRPHSSQASSAGPRSRIGQASKFAFYGLVLCGLGAGSLAFITENKTVRLSIDGQLRTVHTSATDVRGVLASAGVQVGPHDLLAPGLGVGIRGGSDIVISRGHLLDLSVDGQRRSVWVNADSVDEALAQLGFSTNSFVSVSRSKRLDGGTTQLAIYRPKKVTVKVDDESLVIVSAGPTVAQALTDAGIVLASTDRVSVARTSTLIGNQVITIHRVRYATSTQSVSVAYDAVTKQDANSFVGTKAVTTAGRPGTNQVVYQLVYVDGKLSGRVVEETNVIDSPIDQVTSVGTKPLPAVVAAGTAQQIAAGLVKGRGWSSDQFSCLVSLWSKESGWRTNAANSSGAYGIPQALPGSKMSSVGADWQSNPVTQITWGLNYIAGVYGTPCSAWSHSQSFNWY